MTKTLRKTKIHGSELRSRLQLKRLRDNPRNSDLFLPRQEMPTQNSLLSICVGKMVICAGKKKCRRKIGFSQFSPAKW